MESTDRFFQKASLRHFSGGLRNVSLDEPDTRAFSSDDIQPVQARYHYASLWRRIVANLIDLGLLIGLGHLGFTLIQYFLPSLTSLNPLLIQGIQVGGILFFGLCYFSWLESSSSGQATFGKRLLSLKVYPTNKKNPHFFRSFVRNLLKPFSILLGLGGLIMAFFSTRRQMLHDLATATVVVERHPYRPLLRQIQKSAFPLVWSTIAYWTLLLGSLYFSKLYPDLSYRGVGWLGQLVIYRQLDLAWFPKIGSDSPRAPLGVPHTYRSRIANNNRAAASAASLAPWEKNFMSMNPKDYKLLLSRSPQPVSFHLTRVEDGFVYLNLQTIPLYNLTLKRDLVRVLVREVRTDHQRNIYSADQNRFERQIDAQYVPVTLVNAERPYLAGTRRIGIQKDVSLGNISQISGKAIIYYPTGLQSLNVGPQEFGKIYSILGSRVRITKTKSGGFLFDIADPKNRILTIVAYDQRGNVIPQANLEKSRFKKLRRMSLSYTATPHHFKVLVASGFLRKSYPFIAKN